MSACKSALGERSGRGTDGTLARLSVRRRSIGPGSLWDVSDQTTADLMARFYRYLSEGKTKDEALREAQIDLITSPAVFPSHPYHWAAFQLMGDYR